MILLVPKTEAKSPSPDRFATTRCSGNPKLMLKKIFEYRILIPLNHERGHLFAEINDKYRKIEKYLLILLFEWYYTLTTSYLY